LNEKLSFTVEDAKLIKEDPDSSFSLVSLDFFASGDNLHNLYVSEETLERTSDTIKNCPVVWKYDYFSDDIGTHDAEEVPCGVVPESSIITSKKLDDGRTMLTTLALVWKKYSGKFLDFFKRDGDKPVSVELTVLGKGLTDKGKEELTDYKFEAVTVLGSRVQPAIPMARATVLQFAKEYEEEYAKEFSDKYSDIDFTIPESVKKSAQKSLDHYKKNGGNTNSAHLAMARYLVKNDKISSDKIRLISTFFNRKVQRDSITAGFYGGKEAVSWSNEIVSKIDEIDNKIMSYFGDIITFPYSKISDAPENMKKLDGVELTLGQINEIAGIADAIGVDKKKNGYAIAKSQFKKTHHAENGRWVKNKSEKKEEYSVRILKTKEIVDAELKFSLTSAQIIEILNSSLSGFKYGEKQWNKYWVYSFDSEYVYFHDSEAEKSFRAKYSIVDLKATVDIAGKEEVIQGSPLPVEKEEYLPEFAEGEPEDKPKDEGEKEKPKEGDNPEGEKEESQGEKMSLDSNLDLAALMAMLADETEEYKSLVAKHEAGEEMDYAMLCSKMFCKMQTMAEDAKKAQEDKDVYMAENAKLQEYKAGIEKKQFDSTVEYTLQEVSESLPKEEIEKAREQSKEFTLDNVSAWANDLKSLAFSYIKDNPKKKESFTRIATAYSWLPNSSETEDVNEKYAKNGWV